ncbi:MAG TPA: metallopeptidase family protein [Patescibacteria group bacterium]|nr:metallopeptidase family protein [Patescibacteria group bacterium]
MTLEEVEDIVDEAIKDLPEEFSSKLDNVGFVVDAWPNDFEMESIKAHPSNTLLFGLYRGIPKTKRLSSYSALPDKITIFAGPILMISKDLEDAKGRIKKTVMHEIGHHFGMSDTELRKRGI